MSTGDVTFFVISGTTLTVWGVWSIYMQTLRTEDWIRLRLTGHETRRQNRERLYEVIKGIFRRD